MLYRTLKSLIANYKNRNQTELLAELEEKIDVFYAAGKLTGSEYDELLELIKST